jgi:hypothetical protein
MERVPGKSPVLAALPWIFLVVAVFAFFASTGLLVYLMHLLKRSRRSEVSSNFCPFPGSQKWLVQYMYVHNILAQWLGHAAKENCNMLCMEKETNLDQNFVENSREQLSEVEGPFLFHLIQCQGIIVMPRSRNTPKQIPGIMECLFGCEEWRVGMVGE